MIDRIKGDFKSQTETLHETYAAKMQHLTKGNDTYIEKIQKDF